MKWSCPSIWKWSLGGFIPLVYYSILRIFSMPHGATSSWSDHSWKGRNHYAFKFDRLQPGEPILLWKFSYFSTFILGSHFLLPQRANYQKREFSQLQNWMRQRGFSAWGIQTGPLAAHWANFVHKGFHLFLFHSGRPILITPEGQ